MTALPRKRRRAARQCLVLAALLCLGLPLRLFAQEAAETLLQRGYVAEWLVCGPFASDVEGGIIQAAVQGQSPLGDRDYMTLLGGTTSVQPQHLMTVPTQEGNAVWQRAAATEAAFDLAPFFPTAPEGVAFAAFYLQAQAPTSIAFDLQTPLGARIWMNGYPFRDITVAAPPAAGRERFVALFPAGPNLVLFQIPCARWEALAQSLDTAPASFAEAMRADRPLLKGDSGFQFALALKPATQVGNLYIIPELVPANTFSGAAADPRQDMKLALFNPQGVYEKATTISITGPNQTPLLTQETPPAPPYAVWEEKLPLPIRGYAVGDTIPVTVAVRQEDQETTFTQTLSVQAASQGGPVYVVAGPRSLPTSSAPTRPDQDIASFKEHLLLVESNPAFGFDFGTTAQWLPALIAHPDLLGTARESIAAAHSAARAEWEEPDHRLIGSETLWRNLVYGMLAGREYLREMRPFSLHGQTPGIAPQYPQLLAHMQLAGTADALALPNLFPLSEQIAPDGSSALHRRYARGIAPQSVEELRAVSGARALELFNLDIYPDVLLQESDPDAPQPFMYGAAAALENAYPPVVLDGGGIHRFFKELGALPEEVRARIPLGAANLNRANPGSIAAQAELKQAYGLIESRLAMAERWAAFAALVGAEYPEAALDRSWRLLLHAGSADKLGLVPDTAGYWNLLANMREAADRSTTVLKNSLNYLARQANTLGAAPFVETGVKVSAVIAFNPTPHPRSGLCRVAVEPVNAPGLTLVDDMDEPVPFLLDQVERTESGHVSKAQLLFLAQSLPAMGYAAYYLKSTGIPDVFTESKTNRLENDLLAIDIDPVTGDIARIADKSNGAQYNAGPMNRIRFLAQEGARTDGGKGLWTTDAPPTGAGAVSSIRTRETDWTVAMDIDAPFAGGTIRRSLALTQGSKQIECRIEIQGALPPAALAILQFTLDDAGRAPIFGERFGAMVGCPNNTLFDMRVASMDNRSLSGAQPALNWVASAEAAHLNIANRGRFNLGPALILYGEDAHLERAARGLAHVLIRRGIPAVLRPDVVVRDENAYTDNSFPAQVELDGEHGWRILVGGVRQNRHADRITNEWDKARLQELTPQLTQGAVLMIDDPFAPAARAPMPTLWIAGRDAAHTARLAGALADGLDAGAAALPESAWLSSAPLHEPAPGLALFFQGTRLCAQEPDGSLWAALDAAVGPDAETANRRTFHYALYPFSGDWRDANLADQAEEFTKPILAEVVAPAQGAQPRRQSFLELSAPGFVVTAVKPAGYPIPAFSTKQRHPRDGIILRGYEAQGKHWRGDAVLFQPFLGASLATPWELPGMKLAPDQQTLTLHAAPNAIEAVFFLPDTRFRSGPPDKIAPDAPTHGPVFSRYWMHDNGGPPLGGMPLSVTLGGDLEQDPAQLDAYVVNHSADATIEGVLYLRAVGGLALEDTARYYNLAPGEVFASPLRFESAPAGTGDDAVLAYTHYQDAIFHDALHRQPNPVKMTVSRNLSQIKVELENQSLMEISGALETIAPPLFWPELDQAPPCTVVPREAAVVLPAKSKQLYYFAVSDPDAPLPCIIKYAGHGQTVFAEAG